jgi:hypothetical protein
MLRVGGFVSVGNDGLPPRTIGARTLPGGGVVTGVRIVGLTRTPAPIRSVGRSAAGVRSGVRIVRCTVGGTAVRTVDAASRPVRAEVWIIIGACSISTRIRIVNRVAAYRITIIRRIIIPGAVSQNRSERSAGDEGPEISGSIARLNGSIRCRLSNVSHVVNRRARRNGVDLLWNRCGGGPGSIRVG